MNPPTGTFAVNATLSALVILQRDYDAMRALREKTEPSLPKYDSIERRLGGMRRQATKLIDQLGDAIEARYRQDETTAWKRAFGLV